MSNKDFAQTCLSFQGDNGDKVHQLRLTMLLIWAQRQTVTDGVTNCTLVVTDVHTYMYVVWDNEPILYMYCVASLQLC